MDLTWMSAELINHITDWRVIIDEETLSDHNCICFGILDSAFAHGVAPCTRLRPSNHRPRWNYSRLDSDLLSAVLEWYGCHGNSMDTDLGIDRSARDYARWIDKADTSACDMAAPRIKRPNHKRNAHWWNPRLAELRRKCVRAKRLLTRYNNRLRRRRHGAVWQCTDEDGGDLVQAYT